ncbi:hypothetical protein QYE76_049564 [Lolium multiflorum]|uniref:Reverse transcriptase zinc-binding domain-containing protein n=1 Tax=Lolium multiflorum TaxID=4521 RepID=A0AAD8WII5_LOLMU|nr:hypothetical protein QYE76_049564 [Lolium multiflorum]
MQCLRLWEAVEEVEKDSTRPDSIAWKGTESGSYTAKGTYRMLCKGGIRWSMCGSVWGSFSPMKCKVFAWPTLRYRLWISDRRARHGLQEHPDTCYTCLQEEDNIDHIFTLCPYARQVRCRVIRSANLRIADPGFTGNLQRWWTEARKRVRRIDRKRFDSMVISTMWTLWKQRKREGFWEYNSGEGSSSGASSHALAPPIADNTNNEEEEEEVPVRNLQLQSGDYILNDEEEATVVHQLSVISAVETRARFRPEEAEVVRALREYEAAQKEAAVRRARGRRRKRPSAA